MSSLKNPFGEKNGKLILISDISLKENGKNVVAFAHFAKEIFRQKTMGRFDNHILRILESRVMKRLPL